MKEIKQEIVLSHTKKIKTSFVETAVLKTFDIGFSQLDIQNLLDIDEIEYDKIIADLYLKYKTTNMYDTIDSAVKSGQLQRYDLVKEEVKKIAINYSKSLFENFNTLLYFKRESIISNKVFPNFLKDVNKLFIENATFNEIIPLCSSDTSFGNYNIIDILKRKNRTTPFLKESKIIKKKLKTKYNTNNYFNAVRRVFELNHVDKLLVCNDYDFIAKRMQKDSLEKMESIFIIDKYSKKEKQLCIYFDLVNYYNNLEDLLLFGGNNKYDDFI